jgi:hypothetical protein
LPARSIVPQAEGHLILVMGLSDDNREWIFVEFLGFRGKENPNGFGCVVMSGSNHEGVAYAA